MNSNETATKQYGFSVCNLNNLFIQIEFLFLFYRSAGDMFKVLNPYFAVDYLLPRTMIASLKLEMFQDVLTTNTIPLDITLAALYYYLRITYTNNLVSVRCIDI